MQTFFDVDRQLFLLINHLPHPGWLDATMLFLTLIGAAGIVWFIIGLWIFFQKKVKDFVLLKSLFLSGFITWILVDIFLKNLIGRLRPTLDIGAIIVGSDPSANSFSMPSGHATISWAAAVILAKYEPRYKIYFYLLAILISFSRIYLGRHFPADVIVGSLVGWGIGKISIIAIPKIKNKNN